MSARNYLSAREKHTKYDCLPEIKQQKFSYRSGTELPPVSANISNVVNRNIGYPYGIQSYMLSTQRAGTPFSDFFSDSEIGKELLILQS